jgi:L-ribulokinase
VDLQGNERGSAVVKYDSAYGQITETLPGTGERLPPDFALQAPFWPGWAGPAVSRAMRQGRVRHGDVIGIGVAFTSCTMLPVRRDGEPLCLRPEFAGEKYAWPKLWKHHAAKAQADRLNAVARQRGEKWLARYGGTVGLEWFFPKVLETLEEAPAVYDAAAVWLEAGDHFVWRMVGGPPEGLPRSTCQAGYKALWSREDGYPSREFFTALHPKLAGVVEEKMPGRLVAPGERAGGLCPQMAGALGLRPDTPVSAAVIDAHAGVPGAGAAEPGTLVMVLGTSSCHMLNALEGRPVPGVAGVVKDGILPGYYGYETGQAAVGDAFDWLRRTLSHRNFDRLTRDAAALPPGADGVSCVDWFNGCRTPLMDGALTGAFAGLALRHGPAHLYRALLEASAFGLRWIVELLRDSNMPVRRLVATGGLPHHNPLLVQIYADVLGEPITVPATRHGTALGAAILGALAAGQQATAFPSPAEAIRAMAGSHGAGVVQPDDGAHQSYAGHYARYRKLADALRGGCP